MSKTMNLRLKLSKIRRVQPLTNLAWIWHRCIAFETITSIKSTLSSIKYAVTFSITNCRIRGVYKNGFIYMI